MAGEINFANLSVGKFDLLVLLSVLFFSVLFFVWFFPFFVFLSCAMLHVPHAAKKPFVGAKLQEILLIKPSHFPLTIHGPRNYFLLRVGLVSNGGGRCLLGASGMWQGVGHCKLSHFSFRRWITSKVKAKRAKGSAVQGLNVSQFQDHNWVKEFVLYCAVVT